MLSQCSLLHDMKPDLRLEPIAMSYQLTDCVHFSYLGNQQCLSTNPQFFHPRRGLLSLDPCLDAQACTYGAQKFSSLQLGFKDKNRTDGGIYKYFNKVQQFVTRFLTGITLRPRNGSATHLIGSGDHKKRLKSVCASDELEQSSPEQQPLFCRIN